MRVLITNWCAKWRTGTELYVRDLALELQRQGHFPALYASVLGPIAEELRGAGIPVTSSLRSLRFQPDVIHGQHYREAMGAIRRFPGVPALYFCHDHTAWQDRPPLHPRVRRYFGVSRLCMDRLRDEGVPGDKIEFYPNFVDLKRFVPRAPLPESPRRALVFSNYATAGTQLPAVIEACRRAGLQLDIVGRGVGNPVAQPEKLLGQYDVVFAKAKAAIEAMAVGAAVVLCDFGGVGPMVTSAEFDRLQPMNFGFQALRNPLDPECLVREIARYDPRDAAVVRDLIRSTAGLDGAVSGLVDIYQQVIDEHKTDAPFLGQDTARSYGLPDAWYACAVRLLAVWADVPPERQRLLSNLAGVGSMKRAARLFLFRHARR